jgi:uncharacterized protein
MSAIQTPVLPLKPIQQACERFGVRRLEVFGSAAEGRFDPSRSDIDLLVDFAPSDAGGTADAPSDLFSRYFGLSEALQKLLARPVDLVMVGAIRNPYFLESVNRSRQTLYARASP